MGRVLQDVRYAVRQLRRSPGFAITAVLTLGLGIGATTAMYSIVRGTLFAPLSYHHAEDLVGIGFQHPGEAPGQQQTGETGDLLMANAKSFSSVGIADDAALGANFSIAGGTAQSIRSQHASSSYMPTLGISPLVGHTFTPDEDTFGVAPTVVLSEGLWRSALNAEPGIVGRVIHINGDPHTVVGVVPMSSMALDDPDVWLPLQLSSKTEGYEGRNFKMVARLKPGVTIDQARGELGSLTQEIYRRYPGYARRGRPGSVHLQELAWPLRDVVVSSAKPSLLVLSAAVLAVLLMACLNLAGLIATRSAARRGEIAVRTALGARRFAVVRLLLVESALLACCGCGLGVALARYGLPVLLASSPIDLPRLGRIELDWHVAVFAVVVGCGVTLLFGLLPLLGLFRQSMEVQAGASRSVGGGVSQQRIGHVLLLAQVALATTLLASGAMLLSAFLHMRAIPPGLKAENLYTLQVHLKGEKYASSVKSQQFVAAVEARLRQLPGIAQVAAANGLPLDSGLNNLGYPAGHKELEGQVEARFVTPGYFKVAGTNLLAGDNFSGSETLTTPPVVLINKRAARAWWPGRSPIGEYVFDVDNSAPSRVIGVVEDTQARSIAETPMPMVYHAYSQVPDGLMKPLNDWFATTFVIRMAEGNGDAGLAAAATAAVHAIDPEVPTAKFAPMQSYIDQGLAAPRFFSWLAGGFAGFALLLTVIGLFGLLSYQVASRTREFGVRMALGAQRRQVLALVLNNGLLLAGTGLFFGVLGGFALRGVIASMLAGTVYVDTPEAASLLGRPAAALAIAASAMMVSAMAASLIPAMRAASVDPMEALRSE